MARFREIGLPSPRRGLAADANGPHRPDGVRARAAVADVPAPDLARLGFAARSDGPQIVLVNGRFAPELLVAGPRFRRAW